LWYEIPFLNERYQLFEVGSINGHNNPAFTEQEFTTGTAHRRDKEGMQEHPVSYIFRVDECFVTTSHQVNIATSNLTNGCLNFTWEIVVC